MEYTLAGNRATGKPPPPNGGADPSVRAPPNLAH